MEKTISKVLAILLFIISITGGIFYKQLYDIKNELKKSIEETEQLEKQVLVSGKTLEKTSRLLEEAQKANELQNKEALKSIAQRESFIKELEEQLKSVTKQVRKFDMDVNDFKKKLASKEEKLKKLNEMILIKQKEVSQSLNIISTLEQAGEKREELLEARQDIIGNLQNELSSLEEKIFLLEGKLNVEVEKSNAISQTLEDKKKQYEQEINSFTRQISNFETEFEKIVETHSKDLEKLGQLEEINQKDRQLIDAGNEKILELGTKIMASDRKVALLENINSQSRIQLEKTQERIQSLQLEVDLKSKQIAKIAKELKSTLSLRKDETQKAREQILFLEKEMEKKLSMTKNEIAELKSQVIEGMTIKKRTTQLEKEKKEALLQAQTLKKTYNELVEQLEHELDSKNATLKTFEKKLTITFVDRILFDSGRAVLNQEGKTTLGKVGQALKNSSGSRLRIIGHTDNVLIAEEFRYKFPSNWELSASRASSVARFFQEDSGIDPQKMEVVGKSFYHPMSDNTTPEGRSKNRRVEIVIIPDMQL